MLKHFDWGFMAEVAYGRDGQPARMYGIDEYWGVNEPGALNPAAAAANRENFLWAPELYLLAYLPVYKGIVIKAGRSGQGLGFEIPPEVVNGPDYFYSHSYSFYSNTAQVLGVEASINLYRSPKHGYLSTDIWLNNGQQTAISPNGHPLENPAIALRWRSPHMSTWVDYSSRYEMANIKTNPADVTAANPYGVVNNYNFGTEFTVLSPRNQWRQRHDLFITHEFNKHWNAQLEGTWVKQAGDGKSDTVWCYVGGEACAATYRAPVSAAFSSANYRGSHGGGVNGRVIYEFNPRLSVGTRLETYHTADGYFLLPLDVYTVEAVSGVAATALPHLSTGYFNDWTVGANYTPVKYIKIRPEARYDWNNRGAYGSGNQSVLTGASKPQKNQLILAMDLLIWF
jgi:hypothetical protein